MDWFTKFTKRKLKKEKNWGLHGEICSYDAILLILKSNSLFLQMYGLFKICMGVQSVDQFGEERY